VHGVATRVGLSISHRWQFQERPPLSFRVVLPYGRDKAREATTISGHSTAAAALAEIDGLRAKMARRGTPANKTELIVVDAADQIVPRPK
jgi:hypothetical protein